MVGLTFLICILLILTAVGFLFAWMVASFSKNASPVSPVRAKEEIPPKPPRV